MIEKLKINSIHDGLPLDILIATCNNPKAIVQIVHGMCEYKERYLDFINFLNKNGYIVIIHDLRGHGKSILTKDDLGYFYQDGARAMVEDVYMLSKYIKNKYPNLSLYLFGHSMGSLIIRNYIIKYDSYLDGLIVCGSPSYNRLVGVGKLVCKFLILIKGQRYRSKSMNKLMFGHFNKGFIKKNAWICSDEYVVDKYNQDSLCSFIFTLNGFYHLCTLMQRTYKKGIYACNHNLPILFISGKKDRCMINQKAFDDSIKRLKDRGYRNIESKLFDNMFHEILNEKNNQIVYNTIINFLKGDKYGR